MHEYILNLHIHTTYSDGNANHAEIADAALKAGLDAVLFSDHNVWVDGIAGYHGDEDRKVLIIVGEEIHDQARVPQKNHLLVFGAERELAPLAPDPQNLIDAVNEAEGICFIAHPHDPKSPTFDPQSLSWVSWDVQGFTGIELWNAMSEFKGLLKGYPQAIWYAFNFKNVAHDPFQEVLKIWENLLAKGQKVVAVGGSDAHQMTGKLGPIKRLLFPYESHFKAVNTHILTYETFNGEYKHDRQLVLDALKAGHCFVANDLPAPARGFRFTAHTSSGDFLMGDTVSAKEGTTLQIKLPIGTKCRLIKDGEVILTGNKRQALIHKATEPGIYRVEARIHYKGKKRGWIYSNPIYVR